MMPRPLPSLLSTLICLPLMASAEGPVQRVGPTLGAATNFSQGVQPQTLQHAQALGLSDMRDGMRWSKVETVPGQFAYQGPRQSFPDAILQSGARASLVVNWGNPLYDDGNTPQSREALDALSNYTGNLVRTFPDLSSIEVGNEFNGTNFVRGPLESVKPSERASAYVAMLRAASEGAREQDQEMRILGGATHSLPGGWLWQVLDEGGGAYMDAIAVHPYTTPAEQFTRQIAVLRRHSELADIPIEVTEFGTSGDNRAASHLLRNYCQFALAGVVRAVWFPASLGDRQMVPLFTRQGVVTPAGSAFRQVQRLMAGRPVQDAAPDDPFTYGCKFGSNILVIWGAKRTLTVEATAKVFDAAGRAQTAPFTLSEQEPLVIELPDEASDVMTAIALDAHGIIADSFHQFHYPLEMEQPELDPFDRFARHGEKRVPLTTLPGQETAGTPWVPYRGAPSLRPVRLLPDSLVPGLRNKTPVEIVHLYEAPQDQAITLDALFRPAKRSEDGVTVSVRLNGAPQLENVAAPGQPLTVALQDLRLAKGDRLEIAVGPNGTAKGDVTKYRITLSKP